MNADQLLAHYEQIADAPDAIPRLRRFILDLAVRGKLVVQDPVDEPASELLKRIAAEKARLLKAGKFKTLDSNPARDSAIFPFSLPASWTWCFLDDVAAIARGGSPRPIKSFLTDDPDGIPWIKIGDSNRGNIYIDEIKEKIRPEGLAKSRMVYPGDLLLSNSMSFGYPYITNIQGCIHDGWLVIRTPEGFIEKLYLHSVFLSDHAKAAFTEAASGAVVQNLNADKARLLSVPLPPLVEQRRIVVKVDELMTLCDRLESAQTERETTRDRLAVASLARLNAPAPDSETFQSHAAFALANLAPLTTRPDQIKALRQTILNLAVRGKLVPQDPNDEPASELLKRIAAEKERLVKAGEIKKPKTLPAIDEPPFHLPKNWRWTRMREATSDRGQTVPQSTFTYIDVTAIDKEAGVVANPTVLKVGEAPSRARKIIKKNDVIYSCVRPYLLNVAVVEEEFKPSPIVSTAFAILNGHGLVLPRYMWIVLRSPFMVANVEENQRGQAYPAINEGDFAVLPIPLPPLAEQRRIVAKVDTLMTLCDRLEASLTEGNDTRRRLLDTLLHEMLEMAGSTGNVNELRQEAL